MKKYDFCILSRLSCGQNTKYNTAVFLYISQIQSPLLPTHVLHILQEKYYKVKIIIK